MFDGAGGSQQQHYEDITQVNWKLYTIRHRLIRIFLMFLCSKLESVGFVVWRSLSRREQRNPIADSGHVSVLQGQSMRAWPQADHMQAVQRHRHGEHPDGSLFHANHVSDDQIVLVSCKTLNKRFKLKVSFLLWTTRDHNKEMHWVQRQGKHLSESQNCCACSSWCWGRPVDAHEHR